MHVDKVSFGSAKIVSGVKIRSGIRKGISRADNRTFQEILGLGKPKQGVISGFESLNEIHEMVKLGWGNKLTEIDRLYYNSMVEYHNMMLAAKEIEELFGPLT